MVGQPPVPPVRAVDYHTGGEPFRIVAAQPAVPRLSAPTVAAKRVEAMASPELDGLRALLCSEPRGHADMYGGFLVAPDDPGAHLGVLFWHKDGFSTACGHGTMALGAWAVETGLVPLADDGTADVVLDVPSGRVTARVRTDGDGRVSSVDFVGVPSYVLHRDVAVETSVGPLTVTVAFAGAVYAHVAAQTAGLRVHRDDLGALIALAREVKAALGTTAYAEHPSDPHLSGVYGVIWYDDLGHDDEGRLVQRNVTVFADGQVDRSPCGSGTASRVAALAGAGMRDDQVLVHHSIVGSTFVARIVHRDVVDGYDALTPQITGTAYRTGEHLFTVDPADPMVPGFVLR